MERNTLAPGRLPAVVHRVLALRRGAAGRIAVHQPSRHDLHP